MCSSLPPHAQMACVGKTAHVGPAVIAERPLEAAVSNMRMRRDEAIWVSQQ
jgi:hypothetical protein